MLLSNRTTQVSRCKHDVFSLREAVPSNDCELLMWVSCTSQIHLCVECLLSIQDCGELWAQTATSCDTRLFYYFTLDSLFGNFIMPLAIWSNIWTVWIFLLNYKFCRKEEGQWTAGQIDMNRVCLCVWRKKGGSLSLACWEMNGNRSIFLVKAEAGRHRSLILS